jgi:hypothetical protein
MNIYPGYVSVVYVFNVFEDAIGILIARDLLLNYSAANFASLNNLIFLIALYSKVLSRSGGVNGK